MNKKATIEVRSRDIAGAEWIGSFNKVISEILDKTNKGSPQHTYLICTDSAGQKTIIRGGPENAGLKGMLFDDIQIIKAPYLEANQDQFPGDWDPEGKHYKKIVATGTDAELKAIMDKIWTKGKEINQNKHDYKLPIPGCPDEICHVQNSNTAIKTMLEAANLELTLPEINGNAVWAPGMNGHFKHTVMDKGIKFSLQFNKDLTYALQEGQNQMAGIAKGQFEIPINPGLPPVVTTNYAFTQTNTLDFVAYSTKHVEKQFKQLNFPQPTNGNWMDSINSYHPSFDSTSPYHFTLDSIKMPSYGGYNVADNLLQHLYHPHAPLAFGVHPLVQKSIHHIGSARNHISPLVIDMNQDGKINAIFC